MDHKFKFLTIGSNMEIHGKSKELIYNTKFILEVKLEKLLIIKEMKDLIGKKLKLFQPELMIPQFQVMLHLTPLVSDYGNQSQSMNSISSPSTVVIIIKPYKPDKKLNTLQVFFIQTIQLNKESNFVLNNNICWFQPHFRILSEDIKSIANKTRENLNGKTSRMKPPFNLMTPIQLWVSQNC